MNGADEDELSSKILKLTYSFSSESKTDFVWLIAGQFLNV